jgi:hypothetical protein
MSLLELPLWCAARHVFTHLQGETWLLDTGSPKSFGRQPRLSLNGIDFTLPDHYIDLTAEHLSEQIQTECAGLIGADILGQFDHLLDLPAGCLTISSAELSCAGEALPCRMFLGIPILMATVSGQACAMFFDTGSQLSYLQAPLLADVPQVDVREDFYPGLGTFSVSLHAVTLNIGKRLFELPCGQLPDLLDLVLQMAEATGIIGNEILQIQQIGYFPRRQRLVLAEP